MKLSTVSASALLLTGASALPQQKRAACAGNDANTRTQWCDLNIGTDYYSVTPDTGNVVTYDWEITSFLSTANQLNGIQKPVMAVNGQVPGPTIIANWGDEIVVNLKNSVNTGAVQTQNGTGIHFHGIQQKGTFQEDGIPSITQCPVAPGDTITYRWRATQYGTSWWHSHFSDQAWDGVFGGIIINGPASQNYEEDLGTIIFNDWSNATADEMQWNADRTGPPTQLTGLVNGTNTAPGRSDVGKKFETVFEPNKTYRLRFINAAIDTSFGISIDDHVMTVIASDFVPVTPYNVSGPLAITMGQRYDVLVKAKSDTSKDYFIRALPCTTNRDAANINGIIRYDPTRTGLPTSTGSTAPDATKCNFDEPHASLSPVLQKDAGNVDLPEPLQVGLSRTSNQINEQVFRWSLGNTTMVTRWELPSIQQVFNGDFNFTQQESVITIPNADQWTYLQINSGRPNDPPHPIHLHGHDFYILSQSTGTPPTITDAMKKNPPRRDVATLPPGGHLVLAFPADNPGIWLMHCHIGFHTFEGFGLQFVEQPTKIKALINGDSMAQTCNNWKAYASANGIIQAESGI
jgi:FtsP/CotA-like multicopper oxidase with cupredoxin domain